MNELFNNLVPAGEHGIETLAECNALTGRFGLSLTEKQLRVLQTRQQEAIMATGRVEFGMGALQALIDAFLRFTVYQPVQLRGDDGGAGGHILLL